MVDAGKGTEESVHNDFFFSLGIGGSSREVKFIRMFVKQCLSARNTSSTGNRIPKTVKLRQFNLKELSELWDVRGLLTASSRPLDALLAHPSDQADGGSLP